MGCCASSPVDPSPYAAQSSSQRAINTQQPQFVNGPIARPSTTASSSAPPHRPLSEHVNQPLRVHTWKTKRTKRTWSRAQIDQAREEYFHTMSVTRRSEIWQALQRVCEELWMNTLPGASEQDKATAIATGQSILDAAEITIPSGDLADGAYDSFGNFYPLPEHIVADPTNLKVDEDPELDKDKITSEGDDSEAVDEEELDRRRLEKGKAVEPVVRDEDLLKIIVKMSEGQERLALKVGKVDSSKTIARKIHTAAKLPSSKKVTLFYLGKKFEENETLIAKGWQEGNAISAFVLPSS